MPYDIIGDIHGQADKLEALLDTLGYRKQAGTWRHSGRQVIFVGDFVDRGPDQIRSVETVRRMVDDGAALAVMGNHELNAIAWHTPDPNNPGDYLRTHVGELGAKNRAQHHKFLEAVEADPKLHAELIDWFLSLPLWLDLPGLRVVHACWHATFLEWLSPRLHQGRYLTRELMPEAAREPAPEVKDTEDPSVFKAVEALTKGIEVPLPEGFSFQDKDGHLRKRVRVKWWDGQATTYRTTAMMSEEFRKQLPDLPIPPHALMKTDNKPIFFGHYWLVDQPAIQSATAVCVDYSAGKGGPLVAYRFDGEAELSSDKLIWVP